MNVNDAPHTAAPHRTAANTEPAATYGEYAHRHIIGQLDTVHEYYMRISIYRATLMTFG